MRQPLIWIAVLLMLAGAVMLVVDVGAPGLWIGLVGLGIALVVVGAYRRNEGQHRA
jgi:membrane-bound ClpP family serine protease